MKQGLAVLGGVIAIVAVILAVIFLTEHHNKTMDQAHTTPATTNATSHTTSDGMTITDTTVGTGTEVKSGDTVTVKYTGKLADGTVFDSTDKHGGTPATFPLSNVIQGWQEGIPGMKVGGTRILVIPAPLAYGDQSVGGIPAGSTLTFTIELLDTKS